MSKVRSAAMSVRQTRRVKIIVDFALQSGTMKDTCLEGLALDADDNDTIGTIARLELERRELL